MEEKKGCTVINQYIGCCGKGTDSGTGNDSVPVGTVISYMGKKAPKHYLACDGAIYNIAEYKEFSDFIKEEYGAFDFFGGDGEKTFAVPDLRNEFLRGYHGDKEEKLSGDIGVNQEPTNHINFVTGKNSRMFLNGDYNEEVNAKNRDKVIFTSNLRGWTNDGSLSNWAAGGDTKYTSRPTNTAVLYCIKYE